MLNCIYTGIVKLHEVSQEYIRKISAVYRGVHYFLSSYILVIQVYNYSVNDAETLVMKFYSMLETVNEVLKISCKLSGECV